MTAYAERVEGRDWEGLAGLVHPDVVYELPQSRERIRGRDNFVRFNAEYPGAWHIEPNVVLGDDHHGAMLFTWRSDGEPGAYAVAFFEVDGEYITKVTDFWPEPFEPPPGREHLVERW